jgi:hypothetical protein
VPSVSHLAPIHLGLDVHKDTISVAILASDRDGPEVDRIAHDEPSVRRLVGRFPDPRMLRACYEAGPTGYEPAARQPAGALRGDCAVADPQGPPRQGPRPTGATAGAWRGCTAPGSWWRSASQRAGGSGPGSVPGPR